MGSLLFLASCLLVAGYANAEINTLSVDLMKHSRDHHTDKFRLSMRELIVRRGGNISITVGGRDDLQELSIEIKLNEELVDSFELESNRTDMDPKTAWLCNIDNQKFDPENNKTSMNITLKVPVRAGVGQYSFFLTTKGSEDHKISTNAIILFNPWHTG